MATTYRTFKATPLFSSLPASRRSQLGEGPVWDHRQNRLTWVDITQSTLHVFDATSNEHFTYSLPSSTTTNTAGNFLSFAIPCEDVENDGFVCGSEAGLFLWNPIVPVHCHHHATTASPSAVARSKTIQLLEALAQPQVQVDAPERGKKKPLPPRVRANDAKVDPYGRLLWGTMDIAEVDPLGALFSRDATTALHETSKRVLGGCTISNGIDWSPSFDFMYFVDSTTRCVFALPYHAEQGYIGTATNIGALLRDTDSQPVTEGNCTNLAGRRSAVVVYRSPEGTFPDGLCVDEVGFLWIALWGAGQVVRVDPRVTSRRRESAAEATQGAAPTGVVVAEVIIPGATNITSVCFGGPRLSQLFITTARKPTPAVKAGGDDAADSDDAGGGHVFTAHVGVCGLPFHAFQRGRPQDHQNQNGSVQSHL